MTINFVLASASPARRRLLQSVGINPLVCVSHFDESQIQLTDPIALVETLAQRKAEVVLNQVNDSLVLGCDSVLVVNGEIHGKPRDPAEAFTRWQQMRGGRGKLYTGHALIDQSQYRQVVRCGITEVYFGRVSDAQIQAYIATGEPLVCAGGFALEGKGSAFIDKIDGCHSNVIGLSLPLLRSMLAELSYDLTSHW
ncbi:nucleoside triphosphate pyrophosphatase [Chamaesiphon sp. VAR_48_metabat_135_sub]|uniref:Maf family protein n=1 Tax=Chamaesiphon sp. VAR_48_metabat_135_sub TaxID=2964699 RepID=UPI00286A5294|nr:nucleoside triphosphate pyrophosphatase [Chamaesiphon sp. VAR_48_metabat_135_sub]